jgi:hypothetical protein
MTKRALAGVGFGAASAVVALLIVGVPRVGHAQIEVSNVLRSFWTISIVLERLHYCSLNLQP